MIILKNILAIILIALCAGIGATIIELLTKLGTHKPKGIYERCLKRGLDVFFSTGAIIVFSPILIVLTVVGAIKMKGKSFLHPGAGAFRQKAAQNGSTTLTELREGVQRAHFG